VNLGGSTGFEFFRPPLSTESPNVEARNIQAVGNLFRGGVSPIAFVGCVNCLAANNTIVNPVRWVFRILQETTSADDYEFLPSGGGRFVNNIVSYTLADLSTHANVGPDTAPETFVIANNLWYATDSAGDSEPSSLPAAEEGGIYGLDPQFLEAANDDFHVTDSSPASGAGIALMETVSDLDGACYADPPSIGAYEAN